MLKIKVAALSMLLVSSMALAGSLFLSQPAQAEELCWSYFTGWKCVYPSNCALPWQKCARQYIDGQLQLNGRVSGIICVDECVDTCTGGPS